jgi:hypothetical protein
MPTLTPVGCGLLLYNSYSPSVKRALYNDMRADAAERLRGGAGFLKNLTSDPGYMAFLRKMKLTRRSPRGDSLKARSGACIPRKV